MPLYRVAFFNDLVDSYGRPFHACQRRIEPVDADDRDEAIARAALAFARAEGVSHWRVRARSVECVEIAAEASA